MSALWIGVYTRKGSIARKELLVGAWRCDFDGKVGSKVGSKVVSKVASKVVGKVVNKVASIVVSKVVFKNCR